MPHDDALVAETKSWLSKAASDLEAATHDLRAEPPLLEDILFHAQMEGVLRRAAPLTEYAWKSRHPGDPERRA